MLDKLPSKMSLLILHLKFSIYRKYNDLQSGIAKTPQKSELKTRDLSNHRLSLAPNTILGILRICFSVLIPPTHKLHHKVFAQSPPGSPAPEPSTHNCLRTGYGCRRVTSLRPGPWRTIRILTPVLPNSLFHTSSAAFDSDSSERVPPPEKKNKKQ